MTAGQLIAAAQEPTARPCLRGADLRGAELAGARLAHLDLTGARLDGANLERAQLNHVRLDMASLVGARLRGSRMEFVSAVEVDLSTCDAVHSRWEHVTLRDANLRRLGFSRSLMRSCALEGADLSGAELGDAAIVYSNCNRAQFAGSYLHRIETVGTTFLEADLTAARSFFLAREIVVAVLRREIADDFEFAKLVGAAALWPRWCYSDWNAFLAQEPKYYQLALDIFARYPDSGAADALARAWSMTSERSDGLRV